MRNSIKRATTVALTAFAFCMVIPPADAFDFASILQSLSHGVSGWTDLDARETEINTQLTAASSSGQLSTAEADGFRTELNRVMAVESQIKASGRQLSATDAISFTNSLNNLTSRINAAIATKNNSTALNLAAVEALRAQLKAQISEARNEHTMTRTDFEIMSHDLEHNADIQNAFTLSGDAVTLRQAQLLSDDLSRIKVAINQHIIVAQTGVPQLATQRAGIEKRITAGVAARTIDDYQAADFRKDLDRIADMQQRFLSFDGVLTANEVLSIAGELDRLSTRVDYQISMASDDRYGRGNGYGRNHRANGHTARDLDEFREQLTVRLNTAQNTRKLARWEASKLKGELDLNRQTQAQLQWSGDGRLSFDQSKKLWEDLTKFQGVLNDRLAARANRTSSYRQY